MRPRALRRGLAGIVFAIMLAAPRAASAGIIDFIWEMSGPQLWGFPVECDLDLRSREYASSQDYECRIAEWHVSGERRFRTAEQRRIWLAIGGGFYTTFGKDSTMRPFEKFKVGVVNYEPMVHLRSFQTPGTGTFAFEHGVIGMSHFLIVGKGFKRFDNVGLKFMPLQVRYKRVALGYTMRVFPKGFTAAQFGANPATTTHVGREVVNGLVGTIFIGSHTPLPRR